MKTPVINEPLECGYCRYCNVNAVPRVTIATSNSVVIAYTASVAITRMMSFDCPG